MSNDDRRSRPNPPGRLATGAHRPYVPREDPPEVDERQATELLRRLLAISEQAPERNRTVLEASSGVEKRVSDLAEAYAKANAELVAEVRLLREKLSEVEAEQDKSGEHAMAQIKAERDELKENRRHWIRYVVTVIVAMISGAVLLAIGRALK